ncbi:SDR family NAD(P)-dependent oxidoreductase [Oceanobacillus sp. CF4.6]|uniref:SDR family NAD(P)-dependent oxidoreductase n=1 Tax=Oceanobacillus sp. CF4.6 TaxID=3373080 RepID=UPI003EE6926B
MGRLDNKVAVITGAAGGMGASHAELFIKEGAKVIVADFNAEAGQKFADQLGENAAFVKIDVSSEEDWKNLVAKTEEIFGPINILINNAGITNYESVQDIDYETYQRMMKINSDSVLLGMKYAYPSMKKGESGSIVNVSSLAGMFSLQNLAAYTSSKFAVRGLTKSAVLDFGKDNIRVNAIFPGVIRTAITEQEDTKKAIAEMVNKIPLQRIAEPKEISNLVLFFASDESSYITGAEVVIDGGLTVSYG